MTAQLTRAERLRWYAAALALVAVLSVPRPLWLLPLGAATLPTVLRTKSGRRALRRRLYGLLPLATVAALTAVFGRTALVEQAGNIALRALVAALWLTWLTHDLRAVQIEAALRALRVPAGFVALLLATRRFGLQLTATLQAAWAAGVLRGGLLSLRAAASTVGSVAGVVVLRSLDRSERVAIANSLRGAELAADVEREARAIM